ncbi:MAG: tripartite tricarboxylate transporter substrate binding protein [Rubrivivax sp.]|nr:tripartite tricarboxylate transporter substrate binding protein [Rubrivivax sp.]
MNDFRRRLIVLACLGAAGPAARAQGYPARPVKVLVGFAPGGAVDIIARAISQQLQAGLGQPFVVENKPGAGTNIAMKALIESAPDGHTLMLTANSIAANPTLYQPAPYDMARDFTPISLVGRVPVVLAANAQGPVDSVARLVSLSKTQPKSVTYGSPGNGSTPHLAIELFERAAGIELTHVPYKGGAPALNDLLAGHIQAVAVNALEVQPHVKSGRLRVLAVLSPARAGIFPDVPTIAESGFAGFEASVWYGFVGPAGLPPAVVARLHGEIQKALAAPEVRERLTNAGGEVLPGPTARLADLLASERARYDKLIREARIKPD